MTHIAKESGYSLPFSIHSCADWKTSLGKCEKFIQYLLTIEDKRFFSHRGIDIIAKVRAFQSNFLNGKRIGWSTITEQWIKNKHFPDVPRTILQKFREAILASFFSLFSSKEYVLESYLNSIYFGNNIYGIQAAIQTFFGKNEIQTLTDEEILVLLTLIHSPSRTIDDPQFQQYFSLLQNRLQIQTSQTYETLGSPLYVDKFPFISQEIQAYCSRGKVISENLFSTIDCKKGEFISTIDADLSLFARDTIQSTLNSLAQKHVTNASVFAIHPITRDVLVFEGSRDFNSKLTDGQVNIIHAKRQPWSTVKPFLYLLALEEWLHPDTLLLDRSEKLPSYQSDEEYISENYSLKEYWLIRLKKALGNSFNNSSTRLARFLSLQKVYQFYKEYWLYFDFPAEHYGYSLVLWNAEINLSQLVKSYAKLVPVPEKNWIDPDKFLLYDILSDPDNRDISFGVNSILNTSILQAVKTGTSSNFRDNTIVSYSPDMVVGIWFGNNDNTPMSGVTGITGAGYAWHKIMEEMIRLGYIQDKKIPIPTSIKQTPYCLDIHCNRKKLTYQKEWVYYYSAILDNFYDHRDIAENLSNEEKQWLEDKKFIIE